MTEYEINSLILLTQESFTPLVQFWVSISFATVVATFFTVGRMNKRIIYLMAYLYFLSSLYLAGVYVNQALKVAYYFSQLKMAGYPVEQYSNNSSYVVITLAALVFLSGTVGTLFYMYKSLNDAYEAT